MDNLFVSNSDGNNGSAESGWTLYLEHSFPNSQKGSSLNKKTDHHVNPNYDSFYLHKKRQDEEEEEEELDLSMVSDASSGPQIFQENEVGFPENDNECFYHPSSKTASLGKSNRKKKGSKEKRCHEDQQEQSSYLDDTASSPNFNFNTEKSTCQNQLNTLRQSSLSGNQKQKNQWLKGKRFGW